jgi:hypothetical protein
METLLTQLDNVEHSALGNAKSANYTAVLSGLFIYEDGKKFYLENREELPERPTYKDWDKLSQDNFLMALQANGKKPLYNSCRTYIIHSNGPIEQKEMFVPQVFVNGLAIGCI